MVSIVLVTTACSNSGSASKGSDSGSTEASGATQVYAKLNSAAADQQRSNALKLAKDEGGTLSLYTGWSPLIVDEITKEFTKDTGIKVKTFRTGGDDLRLKVLQEASAGKLGADAVLGGTSSMFAIAAEGIFAKYTGEARTKVIERGQFGTWTAASYTLIVPAWNTDMIKKGDEPRSWADLASERFKGKMAIDTSDWYWYAAVTEKWLKEGKSQSEVDELWKKISENAQVVTGHTSTETRMAAGQLALYADAYTESINLLVDQKDAPLSYRDGNGTVPVEAFAKSDGVGLVKTAKHPASAWLFADWLLSEGQKVISAQGKPISTDVSSATKLDGISLLPASEQEIWDDSAKWQKEYDELLRGA